MESALATALVCPKCGTAMEPTQEGQILLDKCPKCGTVWFDRTELAATVSHLVKGASLGWGAPVESNDVPWVCPRGRKPTLVRYAVSDARFYRCTECRGAAVEAGELQTLIATANVGLAAIISELFSK